MGLFDEVCGIQIKCTHDPILKKYNLGDKIKLEDGIYLGYEGWFRILNGKITDTGKNIFNKWGRLLSMEEILNLDNPVAWAVNSRRNKNG